MSYFPSVTVLRVKNCDITTALGPWRVDAADGPDSIGVGAADHRRWQGDAIRSTHDMIFSVPFLIEYFSSVMTLSPGDLILTGTPDGVVDSRDVVVTTIEQIGSLVNTIQ